MSRLQTSSNEKAALMARKKPTNQQVQKKPQKSNKDVKMNLPRMLTAEACEGLYRNLRR